MADCLYHGVLPQYFWSGTGFPGYLPHPTSARVTALATMCINMHVGELDAGWLENMLDQAEEFRPKGYTVAFTVEKGQSHVIGTLAGTAPRGCSMRSRKPSRAADSN